MTDYCLPFCVLLSTHYIYIFLYNQLLQRWKYQKGLVMNGGGILGTLNFLALALTRVVFEFIKILYSIIFFFNIFIEWKDIKYRLAINFYRTQKIYAPPLLHFITLFGRETSSISVPHQISSDSLHIAHSCTLHNFNKNSINVKNVHAMSRSKNVT